MIDIKLLRTDPDMVRENIKKKFQDEKLPLVDEVIALDKEFRDASARGDALKNQRNLASKKIGMLMGQGKREEAEAANQEVASIGDEISALDERKVELQAEIRRRMLVTPQIIDPSVPIGKDDSENV